MATGSLDANGIWIFGEDDSEPTFSGLLNKGMDSVSDAIALTNSKLGKLAQSVTNTATAFFTTTSTSFVADGLNVNITPTSNTSKILVIAQIDAGMASDFGFASIYRGGTNIGDATYGLGGFGSPAQTMTLVKLDSPATTSTINYATRTKSRVGNTAQIRGSGAMSVIVALEIKA